MSGKIKRNNRTRSSKQFCQEKFSCDGERVEAKYVCEECATLQCEACEAKLHELTKFIFHDRKTLLDPPADKLCQLSCDERNFADVRCMNCELNFCHDCYSKMHSHGRRRQHEKLSMKEAAKRQAEIEATTPPQPHLTEKVEVAETPSTNASNGVAPIKPTSPLANDDESLTYVTMPQTQNHFSMEEDESIAVLDTTTSGGGMPDVIDLEIKDIHNNYQSQSPADIDEEIYSMCSSFLLADQHEYVQVETEMEFVQKLGCDVDAQVKVVSIFGNTGDGKSHTLNHTFFGGHEIFKTSPNQMSCTIGVWAAYDPVHSAVVIDTEGLLGVTSNQNQRTRLLLKVLAISDVIIYRTCADRLHNDMFNFLGDASKAYVKHFTQELRAASARCKLDQPLSTLGPAVIIFHETHRTEVLGKESPAESAEAFLRRRFADLDLTIEAFSALQYVGTRTKQPPTDFTRLLLAAKGQLRNISVRSPRRASVIFNALKVLNEKFNGDIEKNVPNTFPDQYFTCNSRCLSCGGRCTHTMNHLQDDIPHGADQLCRYQHQHENKIFKCKACYDQGNCVTVVPKTSSCQDSTWFGLAKYAWAGYVLECPNCGVIFRSRQYWYGNQDPEKSVVRTEICHVWPDGNKVLQGTHNAARRLLDSLNYASETVANFSAKPAKMVGNWVADQIAPPYWVPNANILACHQCDLEFTEKIQIHHCRACGQGFCDDCSTNKRPVPERGWGQEPVRVCDGCYKSQSSPQGNPIDPSQLRARRVGEVITSTVGAVTSVIDYPRDMLLESARPAYWVPDNEVRACYVCGAEFNAKLFKHHCRACGQGVCDACSLERRAVPSRGWDHPVRICNTCCKKRDPL